MIIHIMKDGTVRQSMEGVVIKNEAFYQVLRDITRKRSVNNGKRNLDR